MRALVLLWILAAPAALAAPGTLPSLPAVAARYGDALLVVYTRDGARAGTGFLIASRGVAVAPIPAARIGDDVVVELALGERRKGRVTAVDDATPLCLIDLLRLPKDADFASLALLPDGDRIDGRAWLVGLDVGIDGATQPSLGGVRLVDEKGRWHVDMPLSPGAPILDPRGRVVAVTVERAGQTMSRGVSVERVRAMVERGR